MNCPSCTTEVNFTNTILRDVIVMGVADSDIQLDLLSDKNQNMTLEEIFQFVDAKEAGKRSSSFDCKGNETTLPLLDRHDKSYTSVKIQTNSFSAATPVLNWASFPHPFPTLMELT